MDDAVRRVHIRCGDGHPITGAVDQVDGVAVHFDGEILSEHGGDRVTVHVCDVVSQDLSLHNVVLEDIGESAGRVSEEVIERVGR